MARTKQTVNKQPKLQYRIATFPAFGLRCLEPGCNRIYSHRQSLTRHRRSCHRVLSVVHEGVASDPMDDNRSMVDQALQNLLQLVEGVDEGAAPEPPVPEHEAVQQEASSSGSSVSSTPAAAEPAAAALSRAVAPMKEMRTRPPPRRQAADRAARRWRLTPAVSTDEVYNMLTDLSSYSPFAIAAAARRRLALSGRQQSSLRKWLSVAAQTERRMIAEIRELLPCEPLDGNSAIAMVTRLQAWLQRHGRRPPARVNE